ncbi:hypothetical protein [Wolbachia endosymbiont (group A) of Rhinocyllus conicus]|nr:hypothetical protein [Wolbachia endosymbiont (group A) of Rhinocyllus conicus]
MQQSPLGSRKIDCKQAHYTTFSIKSWIPVSGHWDDKKGNTGIFVSVFVH